MERKYRLRSRSDFRRTRQEGRSWAHHLMVLWALQNDLEHSRFGFSASKRVGKAVVRNRARRRMREAVRLCRGFVAAGWDMIFVARPAMAGASYVQIAQAVDSLLSRAHLRKPDHGLEQSDEAVES